MMRVEVNGQPKETEARTLGALWEAETEVLAPPSRRGFAVALNGEVVRAPLWDQTVLNEGDRVEIIRTFAGG